MTRMLSVGAVLTCLVSTAFAQMVVPDYPNTGVLTADDPGGPAVGSEVGIWSYSGIPETDFIALYLATGSEIVTGGPLQYGSALSGIFEITGPDMRDIIAAVEAGGWPSLNGLPMTRIVNFSAPPPPLGTAALWRGRAFTMVDLWPSAVWFINTQAFAASPLAVAVFTRAAVPEPASALTLAFGAVLAGFIRGRRRRRRIADSV